MASLDFIKAQKETIKEKNKIDFSPIKDVVIEYSITKPLIIQYKKNQDELIRKILPKGKLDKSNVSFEKLFENAMSEDQNKMLISQAKALVKSFDEAPEIDEIEEYFKNELGDFWEECSNKFYLQIIVEFNELLSKISPS